jgi:hypothetical protein
MGKIMPSSVDDSCVGWINEPRLAPCEGSVSRYIRGVKSEHQNPHDA